ncbi:helix-turn-helix domain-containing protein [Actinomadura madurae]|uniref:helix-turn-helix domain-containing protein n=1 Tax=Actinomadura madurae TaxID=1993 RepID=UPI0020D21C4E|nr:helix-turn-helix domain-containing protein [Actinomadura madurae]MCQ0012870.1 helix-turn-helix domain-containing protein [Actinomadura madurae]
MSIGAADGTGLTSGVHMAARNPAGNGTGGPDPRRIVTRQDFAAQLTLLREAAGLTVRQVARASGIPDASAGDYFAAATCRRRGPTGSRRCCGPAG